MMMSPFYASFEQLSFREADSSFDIWPLGIILYTLMAKKEPYIVEIDEKYAEKLKQEIWTKKRDKLSENYS